MSVAECRAHFVILRPSSKQLLGSLSLYIYIYIYILYIYTRFCDPAWYKLHFIIDQAPHIRSHCGKLLAYTGSYLVTSIVLYFCDGRELRQAFYMPVFAKDK